MTTQASLTPLMQQYFEIKDKHRDKILFFRMGDFFELFYEDAKTAAPILGVLLTARNKKAQDETPMCGVPHHMVSIHVQTLLQAGFKVAICDQVEDARFAKGLVKRAVTRILTPGMVLDPESLEPGRPHFIGTYRFGILAVADVASGDSRFYRAKATEWMDLLRLLDVREFLIEPGATEITQDRFPKMNFTPWPEASDLAVADLSAIAVLQNYVRYLSGDIGLSAMGTFKEFSSPFPLSLSANTIKHLEIFSTYDGQEKGSLFQAVDRTRTPMGKRLLREYLSFLLTDLEQITLRQKYCQALTVDPTVLKALREALARVGDLPRRLAKLANSQVSPLDTVRILESAILALEVLQVFKPQAPNLSQEFVGQLEILAERARRWLLALRSPAPSSSREGDIFIDGYSAELDDLLELHRNANSLLLEMEESERQKSGIPSLKIRYNNVFGHYIEVTNTHRDKVPEYFVRKQTLANAERFTTTELLQLESKLVVAKEQKAALEERLFAELKTKLMGEYQRWLEVAEVISKMDVACSWAWLCLERNYSFPRLGSSRLVIESGRHPIVETLIAKKFVPNSMDLGCGDCVLLTGPNMAGKSTLMRQVALICLLAQIGAPVPAARAELPIFFNIRTRMGASDAQSRGLSTFMVEMQETAEILQVNSGLSLLLLDEIGRGTSTYDGLSLAQAILENLAAKKNIITLFASHYHELVKLEDKIPNIMNFHMAISESHNLDFLFSLVRGPAKKSYGLMVAELAGMPPAIVQRAKACLAEFESPGQLLPAKESIVPNKTELKFINELKKIDFVYTTPIEALLKIKEWQDSLL